MALAWSYLTYVEVPAAITSDFVYLRFIADHDTIPTETHGEIRVDRSAEIRTWAGRFRDALRADAQEGFAFFNNHFEGMAPASVNPFRAELGMEPVRYEASRDRGA